MDDHFASSVALVLCDMYGNLSRQDNFLSIFIWSFHLACGGTMKLSADRHLGNLVQKLRVYRESLYLFHFIYSGMTDIFSCQLEMSLM